MTIARLLVAQRPIMTPAGWIVAPLRAFGAERGRVALSVSLAFGWTSDRTLALTGVLTPETPIPGGEGYAAQLAPSLPLRPHIELEGSIHPLEPWTARSEPSGMAFVTFRCEIDEPKAARPIVLFVQGPAEDPRAVLETGHIALALGSQDDRPLETAELTAARFGAEAPQHTVLPFETYVSIAASLMEPDADRGAQLGAHGMTEDRWLVEETAWLGRMGEDAMNGDPSLAILYGELLERERAKHAKPNELRPLEAYARIRVELERRGDPARVLEEHQLAMPAYVRLDAHWEAQADSDETTRHRLEALMETEHARLDKKEARA